MATYTFHLDVPSCAAGIIKAATLLLWPLRLIGLRIDTQVVCHDSR